MGIPGRFRLFQVLILIISRIGFRFLATMGLTMSNMFLTGVSSINKDQTKSDWGLMAFNLKWAYIFRTKLSGYIVSLPGQSPVKL